MEQRCIIPCFPRTTAFVLLLAASTTVLAHDHIVPQTSSAMDMDKSSHSSYSTHPNSTLNPLVEAELSYFRHEDYHWILLTHIVIMSISWTFVLPVSIMLTISRSKFRLPLQLSFLVLNAIGVFASIMYNANTPDLYHGNAHHSLGWVVTWIVGVQMSLALLNAYVRSGDESKDAVEEEYRPLNTGEMQSGWMTNDEHYLKGEQRYSDDSGEGTSLRSSSSSTLDGDHESEETSQDVSVNHGQDARSRFTSKYLPGSFWTKFDAMALTLSGRTIRIMEISEKFLVRAIMPLGYATFLAGIATYGGLFRGHEIFSGLAHWIKGSVFFWYGLLTLGRWAGCFADRGWAWNVLPAESKEPYSAEFVESFLIFFYGVTNVFLEHLSNWGEAWSMMDLQHLGITILFAGGGLCGMLVESTKIRKLLNQSASLPASELKPDHRTRKRLNKLEDEEQGTTAAPSTYTFSTNPMPALTIILLGMLMSSHHQSSMVSMKIHAQWGSLLMAAGLARGATYLLYFLKPPTSKLPGRPPTEIVAAFCLIAGGVVFMVSARDSITALEANGLDEMFVFTVVCGFVAGLMAWELVVLCIKGWAVRRRRRSPVEGVDL